MISEREYELEHAKYLAWERDSLNRLYYGLWIMFLGGFVFSFHVVIFRHVGIAYSLEVAFRFLAIVGTGINFLMQYHAIENLSGIREYLYHKTFGHLDQANEREKQARKSHLIVSRYEATLQLIAGAFLLIAFVGSFFVRFP